ncbi:RagB/SusD family nutrient uptake outer membrane protein [Tamlana sp. 2201CG12-4]|uniref:RagB/SusD family nutrient uptake outer membrane protein n=1 Tax=Tamlana sp. 2201CG12-4 TaxID=3112582 RepID=UPI002DBCA6A0|nr:RagB/SusD family nutrient uptake outer membrane protein [Tamlana sp. 2201CG12-4]MEC3906750.1 RagB/SusD family nutrient uptake outer membrane protein [Tamlana sp. 2201CG12-4]
MKKIKYKLIWALLALSPLFHACSDYLEIDPANVRAIAGFDDVKQAFSGYLYHYTGNATPVAAGTGPNRVFSPEMIMMFESYSDNIDFENSIDIYLSSSNSSVVATDKELFYANHFLYNEFSAPEDFWNDYYQGIGFINALIDELPEVSGGTQEERDQLEGEMKIHRAFFIFKLLQHFATYTDDAMGIPVYLHSGGEVVGVPVPRRTHTEVYNIILEDLGQVKAMLERTPPRESFNVMYNTQYLNNLLAQVYWFKAESPAKANDDYANAKESALIAIEGTAGLIPQSVANFKLKLQGTFGDYPGIFQWSTATPRATSPIFGDVFGRQPQRMGLTQDFMDILDPADIRYGAIISNGVLNTREWPDGVAFGPLAQKRGNFYLFEPEEAYLILAEAHYRLGEEAEAVSILNEFKSFRNAGDATGLTGDVLLQEIKNERRKEFIGAGDHRWLDLKRYGDKTITRTITFFQQEWTETVEPNGYQYALPIPVEELDVNPDLNQNPGWTIKTWN